MYESHKIEAICEYIRANWDETVRQGVTESFVRPLPFAHTVPCISGHFIALFYWDTYFTNRGLLRHGRTELAQSNCDAMMYLIEQMGFMPNSTFLGDDTRSQPPYLSPMVREVYDVTQNREWLAKSVLALEIEYSFWMEKRITSTGLNRHFHHADDEYLLNFYDGALVPRLGKAADAPREIKLEVAAHYLGEAETGWDFNPRFHERCGDFNPVDLNCNLYVYETNFAYFAQQLERVQQADTWNERARNRRKLINELLWHEGSGQYRDYNVVEQKHSDVPALSMFHALWAGVCSDEKAARVAQALPLFERENGVAVCAPIESETTYQWGFPNGWPPLFYTCAAGLKRAGFDEDAHRVAEKYLALCVRHFAKNGQLWEKYDVVTGEIAGGEYEAQPMLGWSAGVFLSFCEMLGYNV